MGLKHCQFAFFSVLVYILSVKLKLPLLNPRQKKKTVQPDVYTRHIRTVQRRGVYLLFGLIGIATAVVFALPYLRNNPEKGASSVSTSSISQTQKIVYNLKTRFNQTCTFVVDTPPASLSYQQIPQNQKDVWLLTQSCVSNIFLRAVNKANFPDSFAKKTFSPNAGLTLLLYTNNEEDAHLIDLARYQIIIAQDIIDPRLLFDPTRAYRTYTHVNEQYFLAASCATENTCELWRQDRLTGLSEQIAQFETPAPRFANKQNLPTLVLLRPVSSEITEVISIDTQNPSNTLKRTFANSDSALKAFE